MGCELAQIAKSIVFRATASDRAVVVVTSGALRVDEQQVAAVIGEPVGKAGADFVRSRTGFAIGGVGTGSRARGEGEDLGRDSRRLKRTHDTRRRRGGVERGCVDDANYRTTPLSLRNILRAGCVAPPPGGRAAALTTWRSADRDRARHRGQPR
ncbi:MAG TPA: YbaK/EbsC family protein [Rhodocyclaceae bacterium]